MTYATTPLFLEYFGLKNLEELPAADELRRIPVQKPESLLTVDPGLATTPPDEIKEATEAPRESETPANEEASAGANDSEKESSE
jgi:segregation and condensation protein B